MLYVLRTTFTMPDDADDLGESDKFLRWLYDTLPTKATMGGDVAVPRWMGNRYTERAVIFTVETQYRNVFAAAADRLRIEAALAAANQALDAPAARPYPDPVFTVMRIYEDAELLRIGDPKKPYTHPC